MKLFESRSESQNVEFKKIWRDEYLQWVCGFANAQGGTLYIGIDDMGNLVGVEKAKKLAEDIPNKIVSLMGIVPDVNIHKKLGMTWDDIVCKGATLKDIDRKAVA